MDTHTYILTDKSGFKYKLPTSLADRKEVGQNSEGNKVKVNNNADRERAAIKI